MGGQSSKEVKVDHGEVIGTFPCKYIGSVPVKAKTGNDVCQNAVQRILGLRNRERPIFLKVKNKGSFIFEFDKGVDLFDFTNSTEKCYFVGPADVDRMQMPQNVLPLLNMEEEREGNRCIF